MKFENLIATFRDISRIQVYSGMERVFIGQVEEMSKSQFERLRKQRVLQTTEWNGVISVTLGEPDETRWYGRGHIKTLLATPVELTEEF